MKVAILHSAGAGDAPSPDELRNAVEGAGHQLVGLFEPDVDSEAVIARSPEVVVAAGGDGMVWRAATAVLGRALPIAILPVGTANNVATSLGIAGRFEELAAAWHTAQPRSIDVGVARAARGETRFLEGVGGGLVARAIAALSARSNTHGRDPDTRLVGALERYLEILEHLVPSPLAITLEGRPIAGEFLLVEVLNMPAVGPNLVLAPGADPSDGMLDVVFAREEHRGELVAYLRARIAGRRGDLQLPTRRARVVDIDGWDEMHVDDEARLGSSIGTVSLSVEPGALQILV